MPWQPANIELHASCAFPTWDYREDPFQEDDFKANFIVRAIKRDETKLKGRWMRLNGRRITLENYRELHGVFHRWAANRIARLVPNPVLIPIPNSGATPEAPNYATLELAQGIAAAGGANWPVYDGLRFAEVLQPSSKGGNRDKEFLLSKMVVMKPRPNGTPVLIDDVCTGGGHLFAAQRRMLLPDRTHAFVCGRTMQTRPERTLASIDETLTDHWWV
ncbi:MAG: hypothetical protein ACOY4K_06610 [Pseudomonadota bacterium]